MTIYVKKSQDKLLVIKKGQDRIERKIISQDRDYNNNNNAGQHVQFHPSLPPRPNQMVAPK